MLLQCFAMLCNAMQCYASANLHIFFLNRKKVLYIVGNIDRPKSFLFGLVGLVQFFLNYNNKSLVLYVQNVWQDNKIHCFSYLEKDLVEKDPSSWKIKIIIKIYYYTKYRSIILFFLVHVQKNVWQDNKIHCFSYLEKDLVEKDPSSWKIKIIIIILLLYKIQIDYFIFFGSCSKKCMTR
jgi:hypothetical protein